MKGNERLRGHKIIQGRKSVRRTASVGGQASVKEEMRRLLPECEEISDVKLRAATLKAWVLGLERGGWKPSDIDFLPFTLLIPECDVSLLAHTRAVTKAAIKLGDVVAEFFSESLSINKDVLISGALVHDVGKLLEFQKKQGFFVKSPTGALLRHPFSGVFLAERAGLPPEVIHIVAVHAHEGDGGYRSAEAIIVNHCDFALFESLKAKGR
ncbi:MAG: HD domain-containing protein [Candidatus Eisenbacteria bacterium]|nr:HD domain-containing protein [Candidatus Eisenbacteria bacterium]